MMLFKDIWDRFGSVDWNSFGCDSNNALMFKQGIKKPCNNLQKKVLVFDNQSMTTLAVFVNCFV